MKVALKNFSTMILLFVIFISCFASAYNFGDPRQFIAPGKCKVRFGPSPENFYKCYDKKSVDAVLNNDLDFIKKQYKDIEDKTFITHFKEKENINDILYRYYDNNVRNDSIIHYYIRNPNNYGSRKKLEKYLTLPSLLYLAIRDNKTGIVDYILETHSEPYILYSSFKISLMLHKLRYIEKLILKVPYVHSSVLVKDFNSIVTIPSPICNKELLDSFVENQTLLIQKKWLLEKYLSCDKELITKFNDNDDLLVHIVARYQSQSIPLVISKVVKAQKKFNKRGENYKAILLRHSMKRSILSEVKKDDIVTKSGLTAMEFALLSGKLNIHHDYYLDDGEFDGKFKSLNDVEDLIKAMKNFNLNIINNTIGDERSFSYFTMLLKFLDSKEKKISEFITENMKKKGRAKRIFPYHIDTYKNKKTRIVTMLNSYKNMKNHIKRMGSLLVSLNTAYVKAGEVSIFQSNVIKYRRLLERNEAPDNIEKYIENLTKYGELRESYLNKISQSNTSFNKDRYKNIFNAEESGLVSTGNDQYRLLYASQEELNVFEKPLISNLLCLDKRFEVVDVLDVFRYKVTDDDGNMGKKYNVTVGSKIGFFDKVHYCEYFINSEATKRKKITFTKFENKDIPFFPEDYEKQRTLREIGDVTVLKKVSFNENEYIFRRNNGAGQFSISMGERKVSIWEYHKEYLGQYSARIRHAGDFNGDGILDFFFTKSRDEKGHEDYYFLSNESGWTRHIYIVPGC